MLSLQVLSNLEMGSVNATGRQSVEGRGAHTAQEHEGEKLLCTVPEPTVVWRHIVLYPLLKPESVMVAIIMTILIRRERSTNEELRTEKLKARPRHAHTVRSLGAS